VKLITTHRLSLLAFVPRRRFHLDVSGTILISMQKVLYIKKKISLHSLDTPSTFNYMMFRNN
jgi:hypothetical protein